MYDAELQGILDNLTAIHKINDLVRVVDPLHKRVVDEGLQHDISKHCFDIWGKDEMCKNCISLRALQLNKTLYKLEDMENKIWMVTSIPVTLKNRQVVVEMLKEVTDSLMMKTEKEQKLLDVRSLIYQMNQLAITDTLTNVYNKQYIRERLPIDMLQTIMSHQVLSIILVDIDYYKRVNDTFGHVAGDEVLKQFAHIIKSSLQRESDWVARFGGEEFIICLPSASNEKAVEIAEIIRKEVESKEIKYMDKVIRITASFGVASTHEVMKTEALLELVDTYLYQAKRNGRNRVEF